MMRNLFDCSSNQSAGITNETNLSNSENMNGNSLLEILEGKEKAAIKKWSFTNEFPFPNTHTNCFSSSASLPNLVLQNLLNTPTKSSCSSKRTFGAVFAPDPTPKPYPDTSRLLRGLNHRNDNEAKRRKMMKNLKEGFTIARMDVHPLFYQKSSHLLESNTHLLENMQRNSLMTILEDKEEDETSARQPFTDEFTFSYDRHFSLNAFRQDLNLKNLMKTPKKSNSKRKSGFDSPYPSSNSGSLNCLDLIEDSPGHRLTISRLCYDH